MKARNAFAGGVLGTLLGCGAVVLWVTVLFSGWPVWLAVLVASFATCLAFSGFWLLGVAALAAVAADRPARPWPAEEEVESGD